MTPILSDGSFPKQFGKAIALLVLPYLAAFLLQSNYLLRVYVALLAAPKPDPLEPEQIPNNPPPNSLYKWRIISAVSVLLIISTAQFNNMLQNISPEYLSAQEVYEAFIRYTIYAGLLVSVAGITIQITHPGKSVVHRTSNGQYATLRQGGFLGNQKPTLIPLLVASIVVFAFLMIAGLSGPNNSFCIAVVTMAYVSAMASFGVLEFRPLVLLYSFLMVIILASLLFIKYFDPSSFELDVKDDPVWTTNLLSTDLRYISFIPAAFMSLFSSPLIACVLRFDFSSTLSKKNPVYLEIVTPPSSLDSSTNQRLGKGVVVPSGVPCKFHKPYYSVALATWSSIRITTIVLCLTTGFPLKSVYDACCLGMFFEFPIMTIVLLLFATMRGEAKALWNYTEVWFTKPSNVNEGELLPVTGNRIDEHITT